MKSIFMLNENRIVSAFKTVLYSDNKSLIVFKIFFFLVVLIMILKISFGIKKQWFDLNPLSSAIINKAKIIFITIGNKICYLFLLKSNRAFLVGASLLSTVIIILSENYLTDIHTFILSIIVVLYLWALVYFIIHSKIVKNLKKHPENELKTNEISLYSNDFSVDSVLNNSEIEESNSTITIDISKLTKNIYTVNKRSGPPRSKEKKEYDKKFYESREWRELRFHILNSHGCRCALCHTTEGTFHVDHIKPRSKYPHLELTVSNLQVLCEDCNFGKSDFD